MKLFILCLTLLLTQFILSAETSRISFAYPEDKFRQEGMEHLESNFKKNMEEFNAALHLGGFEIKFSRRRVTPKGQYLRYWAWQIAKEGYRKSKKPTPPVFPGCDIDWFWVNPDDYFCQTAEMMEVPSYVGAAIDLVRYFQLDHNPGLTAKMSEGKAACFHIGAIGKDISEQAKFPSQIKGRDGKNYTITHGSCIPGLVENESLRELCATYGIHSVVDKEHSAYRGMWTDDGKWQ